VAVAASLLAAVFVALWLQTTGPQPAANAEVNALGSAPAAEPVAAEPAPDLRDVMTELDVWSEGIIDSIDETSVSLHYIPPATPSPGSLEGLLNRLEFSPEVLDRIVDTQAADGTLTATAPQATASWTYDPVDGLSVVIKTTDQ
jgi:hypothetical protein